MADKDTKGQSVARFISLSGNTYKIHIHTPDDKVLSRSIGFKRCGKRKAFNKALKMRSKLGKQLWGKYWIRVLMEEDLFLRLPHNLEPNHGYDRCGTGDSVMEVYRANLTCADGTKKCRKRSVNKYGRNEAYREVKKIILEHHADVIDLMLYMGRINKTDLELRLKK